MALMMAIFAVFSLGAVVLAAALFFDARKWAMSRRRGLTIFMYIAAGCSAVAAVRFGCLSAAIFRALCAIF